MSARIVRSQGEETHQVVIVLKRDLAQAHGKSSTLTMSLYRFAYSLWVRKPTRGIPCRKPSGGTTVAKVPCEFL